MQSHHDWHSSSTFVMFMDNKARLEVPFCDEILDDRTFLKMLGHFYDLRKAEGGLIEALSAKSLARVDVIKLERGVAPGATQSTLQLGPHGSANRATYYFRNPEEITGDEIVTLLKKDAVPPNPTENRPERKVVIAPSAEQHLYALNMVRSWDMRMMSFLVLTPTVLSLLAGIIWTVVAVKAYDADVQTSAQTGFTVASYVVTTGALLIALVTFIDSQAGKGPRSGGD
ncbi:hypothetical protein BU16DRAFT_621399 [Lophium mytilinum]|uniref:Uncharacterized protein n=1 Tax=Lophium mytilinum TaxID=390894 RepID=A0A6A6QGC5_9PEZI|nr:hypothetical protein BU16DRAFT_621399 [Lophium mytilinum]